MFKLNNLGIVIEAPSPEYPFGRLINSSPPGSGNGSPVIAELTNDSLMGFYAALDHFGITPSDLQEQVGDSDLVRLFQAAYPVGSFIFHGADTDPSTLDVRALACDGSTVSEVTYADLFAEIGTLWNIGGEPGGEFRLPDWRGKFPRGWDDGAGVDPARVFAAPQLDQMQGHWHDLYAFNFVAGGSGSAANIQVGATNVAQQTGQDAIRVAITDGVNGAPRLGLQTQPINETAYIWIRY